MNKINKTNGIEYIDLNAKLHNQSICSYCGAPLSGRETKCAYCDQKIDLDEEMFKKELELEKKYKEYLKKL